jgi:thioredoxin-related protein
MTWQCDENSSANQFAPRRRFPFYLLALAFTWFCLPNSIAAADQIQWIRDLETGKKEAKAAGKDLMLVFTGHGWCLSCEHLDREVFQHSPFVEHARKHYVFVEFDLQFGESPDEKEREANYRKLQAAHLIRGVPTVVLADAQGLPYAIITGYATKSGPLLYWAHMQLARAAKTIRDSSFEAAALADGTKRARHLHHGIQAVGWLLGSIELRGDDPVLAFYQKQIADILKFDQSEIGSVRSLYEARRKKRDEWLAKESVFAKLKHFDETRDYRGAIAAITTALEGTHDKDTRWRLERARRVYSEWDGQYEEALKIARRLLTDSDLSHEQREYLLDREAFNLIMTKRIDEGIAHFDRRIAAMSNDPAKRLRLLWVKAQNLNNRGSSEQQLGAWQAYREAEKLGSERWQTATSLMARVFRRDGKHREALSLLGELFPFDKSAWTMVDAAESHVALGESEQAKTLLDRAEAENNLAKKSERLSDRELGERIQKRIDGLRVHLAAKKP